MSMIITHHGGQHFKITHGSLTIAIDPPSKDSNIKATRYGADIVLISSWHEDFNGIEQMSHGGKEPFVIRGPGEYEVQDIFFRGFAAPSAYDGIEQTTVYTFTVDGITVCFLGSLASEDVPVETKKAFDEVNVLCVPIGGGELLDPAAAYKFALKREPNIIIPMAYEGMGTKTALNDFLKEAGEEKKKKEEKLVLKKKDLPANATVVVLAS